MLVYLLFSSLYSVNIGLKKHIKDNISKVTAIDQG